jgi:hypothetical protein
MDHGGVTLSSAFGRSGTGILLEAYSPGGPGAILILEVSDLGKAQSLLARLPLCEAGLIETELICLRPLQY